MVSCHPSVEVSCVFIKKLHQVLRQSISSIMFSRKYKIFLITVADIPAPWSDSLSPSSVSAAWHLSETFCEQSDFLYYKFIYSLSVFLSLSETTLHFHIDRLPLPYCRCSLFICSLILRLPLSTVFVCTSDLIQEKIYKL